MKVYFKSGGVINTGKLYNQIVRDCHGPRLRDYIEEKYEWDLPKFDAIDWAAVKTAHTANTFNQKVRISKAIYGWYPTMDRLHRIAPTDYPSPMCNICKTKKETQNHIFRCNHPASRTTQIVALKQMEKMGKNSGINTYLVRMLTKGIHAWMRNLPPPEISPKKHSVHVAVRDAFQA